MMKKVAGWQTAGTNSIFGGSWEVIQSKIANYKISYLSTEEWSLWQ